ncbi:MAG TPA: hypothetical protein VFY79_10905, partial [Dehalococcoidia bacterium]|nr:hypothetical protein [Dehalococcoidia bacterium]
APPRELYTTGTPPTDGLALIGWSHDGADIVFYTPPGFTADVAGGAQFLRIGVGPDAKAQALTEGAELTNPILWDFGPDAMLAITGGSGRETWTNKFVGLLDTGAGTGQSPLGVPGKTVTLEPAISPDGLALAYVTAPDAPGVSGGDAAKQALAQRRIGVLPAVPPPPTCTSEGCTPPARTLTSDAAYRDEYPQWSADGTQILWVRMDAQDNASLWLMDADGSGQHEVLDGFDVPAFPAPDQRWFGYYGTISWQNTVAWWRPPSPPARSTNPDASATATPDTSALTHTLSLPSLGLSLRYPADWTDHPAGHLYYSCVGCTILGPPSAEHPYGVQIFDEPLSFGCGASCYVGNDTIGVGGGCVGCGSGSLPASTLTIAGIDAQQIEFERQVPLGIAAETGDYTPSREIWTLLPWHGRAVFITAFYREGDTAAEQETRAAYNAILATVAATGG